MGLSARELKKLKALMEREAEDERRKSGSTKSRKRAPLLGPPTADGEPPAKLPPKNGRASSRRNARRPPRTKTSTRFVRDDARRPGQAQRALERRPDDLLAERLPGLPPLARGRGGRHRRAGVVEQFRGIRGARARPSRRDRRRLFLPGGGAFLPGRRGGGVRTPPPSSVV